MKSRIIFTITILFLGVGLFTACNKKEAKEEANVYYTCPMHPEVKKDKPGQCPVCGMDLVKKEMEGDDHEHNESGSDHKH